MVSLSVLETNDIASHRVSEKKMSLFCVSVWTTASSCAMAITLPPVSTHNRMPSTWSVPPRHAPIRKTTWAWWLLTSGSISLTNQSIDRSIKTLYHSLANQSVNPSVSQSIKRSIEELFWTVLFASASRLSFFVVNFHFSLLFFSGRVIVTLTSELQKILANLHQIQPLGVINFETGIRVAHVRRPQELFRF